VKKILLKIWRKLPFWMQRLASRLLRPHFLVAVGGMIFNDQGQLLLCEHTYRRLHSWGLPGGDLKPGEDPVDGIKREIREETGLTVQEVRLLLVESSKEIRQLALTYLCTGVSGNFVPNVEVKSIRYFDPDNLPHFFHEHQLTIEKCLTILNSEK
jgi:8-oxo-dGTP diphosphatase